MSQDQEEAAVELALALSSLVRRIRATAPSESREFSWTQKAVMRRLEMDGAATTAELARAEGVKPQSMGAVIAGLEEMGMVERKPHPTDGRQVNIVLSSKGAALRQDTGLAKRSWLAQAIASLDPAEQEQLPQVAAFIKRLSEL